MKKQFSKAFFILFSLLMLLACSKDDKSPAEPELKKIIVYKNQTGDPNADALQAQYNEKDFALNFYGSFDNNNEPLASKSVTYQKTNNDTIVNLIFNALTNKIASAYITVKSIKQPIVIKFDYIANSATALNVSFHNYDWNTNTSEVIYSTHLNNENGVVTENPYYASRNALGGVSFGDFVVGGIAGVAVAETVAAVAGGFSGIGALSGAAATVVAAAAPVVIAVGVGIAALAIIVNNANASELSPTDRNYPSKTVIENPAVDPKLSLKEIECSQTNISFNAGMDSKGSILISGVSGGQPPYTYLVNSGFQSSEFFLNNYEDGSYLIAVKDVNGCLGARLIPLTRCDKTSLAVTIVKNLNGATATAKGGEPPYTYLWSNGSTNSSINNVAKGTYSVTATDAAGCKKLETISIDSESCDDTSTSFPTVTIGSQAWMQKNLNICKYRNGDDIPQVQDPTEWASLTTGAWCYYGNSSTYGATYGKLYNWYAINDPRGFAPQGYHVPSDAEWTIMTTFLGGETDPLVGNKMKAVGWDQPYTNPPPPKANNSSGFTGLPGGIRSYGGTFSNVSNAGSWWSSTEYENYSGSAWVRGLTERSFVLRSSSGKTLGLSVRCVKD